MGLKQHHFVLVHGGGHGAWCWVKVVAALEKGGHRVTTIDLLSAGENDAVAADDVTSLELYDQPLQELFASLPDNEKVILVGHSLGGMSITRMSELFPKKVSVAVFLSAHMPAIGEKNFYKIMTAPKFLPPVERKFYFKVEGGPATSVEFTPTALKEFFYNKCSPEDFAFALDRVKKYPVGLLTPIHLTTENYGSVSKIYILALDDKLISPAAARKLVNMNPPDEIFEIEGDHSVFFSALGSVERILNYAAAKYDK